ncbi:MAG: hypothetical protein JWO30_3381 [Fibrobacteres bacterium]|nr:hypothetical protein [Fibrobacterota bacterium]
MMRRIVPTLALALLTAACTAPRSVLLSPEALPKGRWEAGAGMDFNVPTQTSDALSDGLKQGVGMLYDDVSSHDVTAISADSLNVFAKALVAYSVDPLGAQPGLFIRYGFWPRLDGGYHYTGGAHAFDLRWQFLGAKAGDTLASGQSAWQASVGAQYSWQSFDLPSVAGLDKLQEILQYEFKRKDILIPLMVGRPFGEHGRYGGFGVGAAYNLSFVQYGSDVVKLVEQKSDGTTAAFAPLRGDKTISSYGGFANVRAGYRWVYLVAAMSAYWQDYGEFDLFGGKSVELKGWTYLPSAALEFRF